MRSPALTTASGKAYLAFCADQGVVNRVSASLVDDAADHFRDELSHVRASVVAMDREVSYPGHPGRREPGALGDARRARRDLDRGPERRHGPRARRAAGARRRHDRHPPAHGGLADAHRGLDRIGQRARSGDGRLRGLRRARRRARRLGAGPAREPAEVDGLEDRGRPRRAALPRPRRRHALSGRAPLRARADRRAATQAPPARPPRHDRPARLDRTDRPPRGPRGRRRRLHRDRPGRGRMPKPLAPGRRPAARPRDGARQGHPGVLAARTSSSASPPAGSQRRTPHTSVEPSALLRELAEIRRSGIATEREECAIGRACIASPDPRPRRRAHRRDLGDRLGRRVVPEPHRPARCAPRRWH